MIEVSSWTLQHVEGGLTKSFEAWFIDAGSVRREPRSLDVGTMTFDALVDFDSNPAFAVGDTVIVRKGGVGFFYGRVTDNSRIGEPGSERIHYELADPWWYLDNRAAESDWTVYDSATSAMIKRARSRVIVGQASNGLRFETGTAVVQVLADVIGKGAPFQIGTVLVGLGAPFEEVTDQTCGELIRHILRWTPDVASWFDFTVIPPRLNFSGRAAAPVITRAIGQDGLSVMSCTPRHDLKIPGVRCIFEKTSTVTVDGSTRTISEPVEQVAGIDTWGTLVFTIQLSGSSESYQTQYIENKLWDLRKLDFWLDKHPEIRNLKGPDGTGKPIIEAGTAVMDPVPPYAVQPWEAAELFKGAIPNWLKTEVYPTTCKMSLTYLNEDPQTQGKIKYLSRPFAVQINATALNGLYSQLVSATDGEEIPAGLATAILAATSVLQWQGKLVFETAEVAGAIHPGHLLNVTGGRAEWETMKAQVQVVTEDIGSGTTEVVFGPPRHLGPQDFLTLMRMNRKRDASMKLQERLDGIVVAVGLSVGPAATANTSASATLAPPAAVTIADKPATNPSQIIINPSDIPPEVRALLDDLKHLKVREVRICHDEHPDDDNWYMSGLFSGPYQK